MKYFDSQKWKQLLQKEFVELDKFNAHFSHCFSNSMYPVLGKYHSIHSFNGNFNEFLSVYASHFISVVESVIEKDKNYSAYRIKVELERMSEVVAKISKPNKYPNLGEEVSTLTKKLTTDYFPEVYKFTGDGFRLLELNLQLFIRDFQLDFKFGTND